MIPVAASTNGNNDTKGPTFTILSYNCLTPTRVTQEVFSRCNPDSLLFANRWALFAQQLRKLDADIVCLQEILMTHHYDGLSALMEELGYATKQFAKTNESDIGVATFFKIQKFDLDQLLYIDYFLEAQKFSPVLARDNSAIVCKLEIIGDDFRRRLCVANVHLSRDSEQPQIQLFQLKTLFNKVENWDSDSPFVLVGDFNSPIESVPVDYIHYGCIPEKSIFFDRLRATFTPILSDDNSKAKEYLFEPNRFSGQKLASAYNPRTFEMPFTTHHLYHGSKVVDYIWYEHNCMRPVALYDALAGSNNLQHLRNFTLPNQEHPSDHLPIMAEFQLLPPKD